MLFARRVVTCVFRQVWSRGIPLLIYVDFRFEVAMPTSTKDMGIVVEDKVEHDATRMKVQGRALVRLNAYLISLASSRSLYYLLSGGQWIAYSMIMM